MNTFGHQKVLGASQEMRKMTAVNRLRVPAVAIAVALAVSLATVVGNPAYGATITVTSTADIADANPGDGRCDVNSSQVGDQCTLRAAIQETNTTAGLDTIDLPPGLYKLGVLGPSYPDEDGGDAAGGDLDILQHLNIRGASSSSTIIDGDREKPQSIRVFQIGWASSGFNPVVTISDVTVRNGQISSGGPGGIDVQSGSLLELYRVVVRDNRSSSQGAGIRNSGQLSLVESTVTGNDMPGQFGGGLQASGGGILNFGELLVEKSTISNNGAARGGGIWNQGSVTISQSTISGNRVYGGGGGIFNNLGTLYINGSTITNNEANRAGSREDGSRRGGGGIRNVGSGEVRMGSTILAGNTNHSFPGSSISDSPDCYSTEPSLFYSYRDNIEGLVNDECNIVDVVDQTSPPCADFYDYDFCSRDSANPLDPKLNVLGNRGGPTDTHQPLSDSLAIDSDILDTGLGETFFDCRVTDQRGGPRPQDGVGSGVPKCDMGAYEVDATVAAPPVSSIVTATLGTSTVPVRIRWSASSFSGPVARYGLQQSTDGSAFASVMLPSATTTTIERSLQPGHTYRFEVRTQDQWGSWSAGILGPLFRFQSYSENSSAVSYPSGTWTTSAVSGAFGGSVRHAKASGARAQLIFKGSSVGWASTKGPDRGKAEVRLDGVKQLTVDLYSATTQPRRMVFSGNFTGLDPSSSHMLEVRVLGTRNAQSTDTRVDIDTFVVLR